MLIRSFSIVSSERIYIGHKYVLFGKVRQKCLIERCVESLQLSYLEQRQRFWAHVALGMCAALLSFLNFSPSLSCTCKQLRDANNATGHRDDKRQELRYRQRHKHGCCNEQRVPLSWNQIDAKDYILKQRQSTPSITNNKNSFSLYHLSTKSG